MDSRLDTYDRQVDRDYRRWLAATLPPPLRRVALALPHQLGHARRHRWRSWRDLFGTPVFRSLPYLIGEGFPGVGNARIRTLGSAHVLLIFLALIDDRVIDEQVVLGRDENLVRRAIEVEAQARLASAVDARGDFWRLFRRTFHEYTGAHAAEPRVWQGGAAGYDHRRYARDSAAKTSIGRLPGLAVAMLGGAPAGQLRRLSRLIDHYLVGMQYFDDAVDWEEDFRGGRWTYFIWLHLDTAKVRRRGRVTLTEMRARVAGSSQTEVFFERGSRHYAACAGLLGEFDMPAFRKRAADRRDALRMLAAARRQQRLANRRRFARELRRCWLADGIG